MCITVDILQYSMPLAFLPSVLEDRGHSTEKIATAIGVYYWTGLLGGVIVTSYEVWKMFYVRAHEVAITPFLVVKQQIKLVIFNLGIGVFTLFIQASCPRWHVHTICRFVQGFVGAFLFFFVFLLNVAVFKGQQQVTAMTCASCATVLAELAGPLLGSILFDAFGQRSVFWFLGIVSCLNQGMLVGVLYSIRPTEDTSAASTSHNAVPTLSAASLDEAAGVQLPQKDNWWTPQPGAWTKMKALLQNPTFICANLIITMAGVIKGSVEEMLPFHADHEWGYKPFDIGKLFCVTAVAYFAASALVSEYWIRLGRFQIGFSSHCILLLGVASCVSFHVYNYYKDDNVFFGTFVAYGFFAGLTFTSAAQLIAEVVDHAEGHAKDAANGIWNASWELGGSIGFFLGGFIAHHYNDQMWLTTRYMMCAFAVAFGMVSADRFKVKASTVDDKVEKSMGYGSTA